MKNYFFKSTKENSKIYIYSKIKTEYEMNNYILNINYEDRKLSCKMRVSDHFLEIERGRYTRIKKENRICKFCELKDVEDEFHFFFRCKNNHTLKNILCKDINGICPKFNEYDRAKTLQLILSSSQIMRFTVPFVKKSIALRRVGLYCCILVIECRSICFHFICTLLLCLCLFDLCTLFGYIPCICLHPFWVKLSIE